MRAMTSEVDAPAVRIMRRQRERAQLARRPEMEPHPARDDVRPVRRWRADAKS